MDKLISNENWFVACHSKELGKNKVIKRVILNENMAIYRGDHSLQALENRCPHKMIELSLGRIKKNSLHCKYHGWEFGKDGKLLNIPCKADGEALLKCKVRSYDLVEQNGLVWIWMGASPSTTQPPKYEQDSSMYWYDFQNTMEASADIILENGLDCAHTGFVHEGFFRSEPESYVDAIITTKNSGFQVETIGEGEKKNKSLMKYLSKSSKVYHTDEYIMPHTVYVDYISKNVSATTLLICTPETQDRTRVYTRMGTKFRMLNSLANFILKQIVKKVISQDKIILENQHQLIKKNNYKRNFIFSKSDLSSRLFFKAYDSTAINNNQDPWIDYKKEFKVRYLL